MQSQVPRWRWWIHFVLIGGYFFPGLIQGLYFTPRYPLVRHSGQGLLIVCGLNLVIFTIVFLLGWLASRARPPMNCCCGGDRGGGWCHWVSVIRSRFGLIRP